ncbi:hypothetical protein C0995_002562 [Termitomyces sp. Mi166|nr:hypothetical protein C0995_002562 [Termitomyces sp. Mi166\
MSAGLSAGAKAVRSFRIKQLANLQSHVIHNGPLPAPAGEQSTPHRLPNPFVPHKNPLTGRWAPPTISLRRQADLVKKAKASNTLYLLPPGPKNPQPSDLTTKTAAKLAHKQFGGTKGQGFPTGPFNKEKWKKSLKNTWMNPIEWVGEAKVKEVPGAELGTRLYAAKKRMFKGHRWERLKAARDNKKKILMRDMARRIRNYKGEEAKSAQNIQLNESKETTVLMFRTVELYIYTTSLLVKWTIRLSRQIGHVERCSMQCHLSALSDVVLESPTQFVEFLLSPSAPSAK